MTSSALYTCHVDGNSCEVADAVVTLSRLPGSRASARLRAAFEQVADCLPCAKCREATAAVDRLRGARFGKHERNILLYSPGPTAQSGAILDPELSTHSDRETYLRAIRKLTRLGLLDAGRRLVRVETEGRRKDGSSVSRAYAHRTLRQTELGAIVVDSYRSDMESGRPIRWERHIHDIRARVRSSAADLLASFAESLEGRLEQLTIDAQGAGVGAKEARELRYLVQPLHDALRQTVGR